MKKTVQPLRIIPGLCLCLSLCGCHNFLSTSDAKIVNEEEEIKALYTTKNADAPTAYSDDEIIGDRTELYDRVTVTSQNSLTFSFSQSDYGNYTDTSLRDVRRYYGYLIRYATNEDMDDATELHVYHSAAIENKYPDMRKTTSANKEFLDDVTITNKASRTNVTIDNLPSATYWYEITYLNNQADEVSSDTISLQGNIEVKHKDTTAKTDQTYDLDGGISLVTDKDGHATLKGTGECGDIDATKLMGEDKAKALTSLTIEEGITNVKGFHNSGIKSLSLPDGYETITSGAFSDNASLYKVSFGDDVKSIEEDAFKDDTALLTMTLPEKLESFSMIDSLVKLTFNDAFEDYSLIDSDNLKEVVIGKGLKKDMALFKDAKNLSHIVNRADKTISFTSLDARITYRDPSNKKYTSIPHGDYMVRSTIPDIIYDLGDAKIDGDTVTTYEYGKVTELAKAKLGDLSFVTWGGYSQTGQTGTATGLSATAGRSIDATTWKERGPITVTPYFEDLDVTGGKVLSFTYHDQALSVNRDQNRQFVVKYSQNKDMSDYGFMYITADFDVPTNQELSPGTWYYTVQLTQEQQEEDPEGSVEYLETQVPLSDVIKSGSVEIE